MKVIRRAMPFVMACLGVACPWAVPAAATEGPTISVDRAEVAPGDQVVVSLSDFTGQVVTVAVCGNLAKRGSTDCNMVSAQSERIRRDEAVTLTALTIQPPPVPCPCLIRASTNTNEEFAVTGIVLLGHPDAPVVDPVHDPLVDVTVAATRSTSGLLDSIRSALGGRTPYAVTVSIRNRTTETLSHVVLSGSARHRLNDDAATLELDAPGPIDPGQTWETTVEAELPAPVIGRYTWTVVASGAGQSVSAGQAVTSMPIALYLVVVLLGADLVAIAWRFVVRRRRRRQGTVTVGEPIVVDLREGDVRGAAQVVGDDTPIGTVR